MPQSANPMLKLLQQQLQAHGLHSCRGRCYQRLTDSQRCTRGLASATAVTTGGAMQLGSARWEQGPTRGEGGVGAVVLGGQGGLPCAGGQALHSGEQEIGGDQCVGLAAAPAPCQLLKRNLDPTHNQATTSTLQSSAYLQSTSKMTRGYSQATTRQG